jgi:hypothetical protein
MEQITWPSCEGLEPSPTWLMKCDSWTPFARHMADIFIFSFSSSHKPGIEIVMSRNLRSHTHTHTPTHTHPHTHTHTNTHTPTHTHTHPHKHTHTPTQTHTHTHPHKHTHKHTHYNEFDAMTPMLKTTPHQAQSRSHASHNVHSCAQRSSKPSLNTPQPHSIHQWTAAQ